MDWFDFSSDLVSSGKRSATKPQRGEQPGGIMGESRDHCDDDLQVQRLFITCLQCTPSEPLAPLNGFISP